MARGKPQRPPKERLAAILKSNSTLEGVKEFRVQCRDVYRLGGVFGLDHWVEARRDLGLLENPDLEKVADDLQGAIGSVIDSLTLKPQPEKEEGLSWDERLELINKREAHQRRQVPKVGHYITRRPPTCAERMAAAYDRLVGIDFEQRRGAP